MNNRVIVDLTQFTTPVCYIEKCEQLRYSWSSTMYNDKKKKFAIYRGKCQQLRLTVDLADVITIARVSYMFIIRER